MTAIEPSPTEEATLFTEPWRTSPAAKMEGKKDERLKNPPAITPITNTNDNIVLNSHSAIVIECRSTERATCLGIENNDNVELLIISV